MNIRALTFVLLACLAWPMLAAEPFTAADFVSMRTPNFTAISPDGARVAYTLSAPDLGADVRRQSVWLVDARGGAPVKIFEEVGLEPALAPAWSRDGARLAIPVQRDVFERGLVVFDRRSGKTERLTDPELDVTAFAWSPSGDALAVVAAPRFREVKTTAEPRVVTARKLPPARLHVVDLRTRAARVVAAALAPQDVDWSPDGKSLAVAAANDLYRVDVASGEVTRLTDDADAEQMPRWSPDSTQLAFSYGRPMQPRMLGVIPAAGGTPKAVGEQFASWTIGQRPRYLGWSRDGRALRFATLDRMTQQLFEVSLDGGAVRRVTSVPGAAHGFSIDAGDEQVAFIASEPSTPPEVFVSPVASFVPRRLTQLHAQLAAKAFGTVETLRWTSRDGLELQGLVLLPPTYERGRRYPTIVYMVGTYGSFDRTFTGRASADGTAQTWFPFSQHALASAGFVVFMPNPRGSWGFGADVQKRGWNDFADGPFGDIMSGVDALVERGLADPQRLGILGSGYDAYRTAYAISQTTRFGAAAVSDVEFDLVSLWGNLAAIGGGATFERALGGPPWKAMDAYVHASPVTHADRIRTPTFLFRTEAIPGGEQSDEMAAALSANGVPYAYVVYPNRGDLWLPVNPKFQHDAMQRTVEWMKKWLIDAAPPR